ncbi:NepR family anti-sigma factor [Inquilinus limosus]|uniref:NepR family anti-sigma factor n=1 Tax=Inquilinus limosus TaxID=171674 RepID=UPI000554B132|nr:NepR family anti-sigma factor [Inquilinus limosus]
MNRRRGERTRRREPGARPADSGRPAPDRLKRPPQFDNWLSQQLRSLYDPVLEEPLPEDLMRMLEESAKRGDKPEEDEDR